MLEINGERFTEGDTVRFPLATLPDNRTRDYLIAAVSPDGIHASAGQFAYGLTRATAEQLGITHAPTR
ncbi:hypothetical protein AB0465_40660 [Streptomyces griseoviridis]|uniref:hypothetical protein n=1 Tax=Streptomyces griseoviridis TaxID=45398 RepID=UPI00340E8C29